MSIRSDRIAIEIQVNLVAIGFESTVRVLAARGLFRRVEAFDTYVMHIAIKRN